MTREPLLLVEKLRKHFTLHLQGGLVLGVLDDVDLAVAPGECVVLAGPSGAGKSTLMRCLYANYKPQSGSIRVHHRGGFVDMANAAPHDVLAVRRETMGYVSQFRRVIPRVPAREIVAEPLRAVGVPGPEALARAEAMLARLNIPPRLWGLPPATFSGGEQQRVNLARCFVMAYPVLLLDEPTAALDAANRRIVLTLIDEAKRRGSAIVGIFHDEEVRDAAATRTFTVRPQTVSDTTAA
ncbi:MAG: phosphonate C-P lyase system protein PhnL [Alphaproteobacteria bacterium]|nr:phosphonate C-P lyase system protein PhnL [Alphaproteobacteria bacterium]